MDAPNANGEKGNMYVKSTGGAAPPPPPPRLKYYELLRYFKTHTRRAAAFRFPLEGRLGVVGGPFGGDFSWPQLGSSQVGGWPVVS